MVIMTCQPNMTGPLEPPGDFCKELPGRREIEFEPVRASVIIQRGHDFGGRIWWMQRFLQLNRDTLVWIYTFYSFSLDRKRFLSGKIQSFMIYTLSWWISDVNDMTLSPSCFVKLTETETLFWFPDETSRGLLDTQWPRILVISTYYILTQSYQGKWAERQMNISFWYLDDSVLAFLSPAPPSSLLLSFMP